jgi:hypothetical protein
MLTLTGLSVYKVICTGEMDAVFKAGRWPLLAGLTVTAEAWPV